MTAREELVPTGLLAGLLLLAVGCSPAEHPRADRAEPPDVLLISLDTVRRDHLGVYGYQRPTTPRLDELARSGAVYDQAITASTQTGPAHASFFTGLDPHAHGAEANGTPIREGIATLAEHLAAHGYRTAGFVSGYPMRAEASGLDRGFGLWDARFDGDRRPGAETVRLAADWLAGLEGRGGDGPWFLFLHLYDAHGPYLPPPGYEPRFRSTGPPILLDRLPPYQIVRGADGAVVRDLGDYRDRYDTMIRYQDDLLADLLRRIDLARTIVMVVSDHGETLGERYWPLDHGGAVWEEQVRIPWIVAGPGVEPGRSDEPVRGVDLAPRLLDLLGLPGLGGGEARRPPRFAVSTAIPYAIRHRDRGFELTRERPILGLRTFGGDGPAWKLIAYPCGEAPCVELYDLDADPAETRDLSGELPERRDRMLGAIEAWYDGDGPVDPESLDPEVRERLESLGYVGG